MNSAGDEAMGAQLGSLYRDAFLPRIPYYGKVTCCHSQTLLSAYLPPACPLDLMTFELLTTVPFGLLSVPEDPNRLLTCYLDPDLGLDRALMVLGLNYEVCAWPPGTDGREALTTLITWVHEGPVVLGPLNMEALSYLFHPELLYACDHYIVVQGIERDRFRICDTEGYITVYLTHDQLMAAWRGDLIPEGRGEFVLRRVKNSWRLPDRSQLWLRTLPYVVQNLNGAQEHERGGAAAYAALAESSDRFEANPSAWRGLTFVIPTRMQRLVFQEYWFRESHRLLVGIESGDMVDGILSLITKEIQILSEVLAGVMERKTETLVLFRVAAELEEQLTESCLRYLSLINQAHSSSISN